MELTYTPQFQILANGSDITTAIKKSFKEITISDVSGDKADTLTILLDGSRIGKLPKKNAALQIALGFNYKLYKQGVFYISSISDSGFPEVVTIKATSIPMGGKELPTNIQTQRTQSWENTTISDLLNTVAKRNKLTPIVNEELGAIVLEHEDQTAESDMALVNRLARQYGAISKVANENWLFLKMGEGKNASGTKTLPTHVIHKSSCSNYSHSSSTRTEASSVIAKWQNAETGENGVERAGSGEPAFEISYPYPTQAEALAAAKAKADSLSKSSDSFNLTTEATHKLIKAFAEGHIEPKGWRSEISDRKWNIKQIDKKLSKGGGLTISISSEAA